MLTSSAYADDLIDSSTLKMRPVDEMNMSGMLPAYAVSSLKAERAEAPEYNLSRMKLMNPNFTAYPDAMGIIWLKHVVISRADDGGMEIVRLYVILGRRGLGSKWLKWNIPIPAKGSTEILETNVYDFDSLAKVSTVSPKENTEAGIKTIDFQGLPDTFILSVAWREELPEQITVEGLCWFQEELRVWESIVEVYSPQQMAYKTFPERRVPEVQQFTGEIEYSWRRINLDPYISSGELARTQRAGVAFSARQGNSGIITVLKDAGNSGNITADILSGFKGSKSSGVSQLIEWLKKYPEIELAEGNPRRITSSGALTRREKILLANSWAASHKAEASLCWQLPFDPDEDTPLCPAMFYAPVLEVQEKFYDMTDPRLLTGAKIFSMGDDGRKLISRRIPSSKSGDNRLSAIMNLRLSDNGLLNGNVKVILRGAWEPLMLGNNPSDGVTMGAVLSMFPGLTNYSKVKYKKNKDNAEISFVIENKPGIADQGTRILAILPFFEPIALRRLGTYEAPIELRFPFVIDQNITLGLPKAAKQALVQGNVSKGPEKINFSSTYNNRRHRLLADSRIEVNMPSISAGNKSLLQRNLDQWRVFSSKHIPVR